MFYGRESLFDQLTTLWEKGTASLVTCRGRRRVGKSTLIEEFALRSKCRFIKIEGLRPGPQDSNETELAAFARQLPRTRGAKPPHLSDWSEAFAKLNSAISNSERTVVLLDEVSWLAHFDATFSGYLKIAWDNLLKKHRRLVLVVCGSVSTWIRDNIIDNGAFYGRRSLDIVVPELPVKDCVKFWGRRAKRTDPREILDVLSVTGGIPRYLEEINPRLTAEENIRNLCYLPKSVLREDFDEMFRDVITNKPNFTSKVLRCLMDGPKSGAEIEQQLEIGKGGDVSSALTALVESGLAAPESKRNPETGKDLRERRYRLKDNYARFYLKFIEPHKTAIDDGAFHFSTLRELDGIDTVLGLAFENLVISNYRDILPLLHLDSTLILSAGPYRRRQTKCRAGCQVDLLIQTRRMLYFVEIKRQQEISREVIDQVDRQVRAIPRPIGVSAKAALVYVGHLSEVAAADGYFDAIVPFEKLLQV